jgi:hypothetical protein
MLAAQRGAAADAKGCNPSWYSLASSSSAQAATGGALGAAERRIRYAVSAEVRTSLYSRDGLKGASPANLAWLSGSWYADLNGDAVEEHWSPLRGNMLMAMFRWIRAGQVVFYEIEVLEAEKDHVYLRIRHFDPGLIGWEEKAKPHEFVLVEHTAERLVFYELDKPDPRWAVYDRRGPDELVAYFTHGSEPDPEPGVFRFRRCSSSDLGSGAGGRLK